LLFGSRIVGKSDANPFIASIKVRMAELLHRCGAADLPKIIRKAIFGYGSLV
jgi:hypothetical protein